MHFTFEDLISIFIMVFGLGFFLFVMYVIQRDDENRWKRKQIELHDRRMGQLFHKRHGPRTEKK